MLQSQNRAGLAIGDSILQRGRISLNCLREASRAAIAIPEHLRTNGKAEATTDRPMHRQLGEHPQRLRVGGRSNLFRSNMVLKRYCDPISFAFEDGVGQETPELERGLGLMRAVKDRLLESHMTCRRIS